jgi:hypothetical protein
MVRKKVLKRQLWRRRSFFVHFAIVFCCLFPINDRGVRASTSKVKSTKIVSKTSQKNSRNLKQKKVIRGGRVPIKKQKIRHSKLLNATGLYKRAVQYFNAGRYPEAIQYAAAAQRRSAGSALPTTIMARSYYRLGMTPRSAKLFLSIPLTELPKDAALEYLLAMFATRRYADVVRSFRFIPDNHPYRDVAKFYLGSSLLQLKQYQKASFALRSARKLPVSLKVERRQLLASIKDMRTNEARGQFAETPQYFYSPQVSLPPPMPGAGPGPILPGGVPKEDEPSKKSPPNQGFMSLVNPKVSYNTNTTRDDFNGYNLKQTDTQGLNFSVDLGLKYLGEPRSFGGQPSLDLVVTPSFGSSDSKTSTSKLTADSDNPSNVQNESSRTESKSSTDTINFSAVGMLPISDPLDLKLGFAQAEKTVKSTAKTESSSTTLTGKLSGDFDLLDFSLEHTINSGRTKGSDSKSEVATSTVSAAFTGETSTTSVQAVMKTNNPVSGGIKGETNFELSWARPLGDYSFELSAAKKDLSREPLSAANIALSETLFKAELGYSLDVGVSLTLTGGMSQLDKMPILKDSSISEGPDEIFATGDAKKFSIAIKYAPVGFASAGISYEYTSRNLTVGDENFKLKLLKDNWSQKTVSAVNLGVSYSF